jgi:hypothetical protein
MIRTQPRHLRSGSLVALSPSTTSVWVELPRSVEPWRSVEPSPSTAGVKVVVPFLQEFPMKMREGIKFPVATLRSAWSSPVALAAAGLQSVWSSLVALLRVLAENTEIR